MFEKYGMGGENTTPDDNRKIFINALSEFLDARGVAAYRDVTSSLANFVKEEDLEKYFKGKRSILTHGYRFDQTYCGAGNPWLVKSKEVKKISTSDAIKLIFSNEIPPKSHIQLSSNTKYKAMTPLFYKEESILRDFVKERFTKESHKTTFFFNVQDKP